MQRTRVIISAIVLGIVAILILISTQSGLEYYYSVDEIYEKVVPGYSSQVRVNGVVIGESISFDKESNLLTFEIAQIPLDRAEIEAAGGIDEVLHQAAADPSLKRIWVTYEGSAPDMLKNEAQAIVSGKLGDDFTLYADELLLQCPSKYEEQVQ